MLRASLVTQAQALGIAGLLVTHPISPTPWIGPQILDSPTSHLIIKEGYYKQ